MEIVIVTQGLIIFILKINASYRIMQLSKEQFKLFPAIFF